MKTHSSAPISKRILGNLLNSLNAGVPLHQGLEYVAIGREKELAAFLHDLENLKAGMGAFRFIVGPYGSGKSFLFGLYRARALGEGFVCADCDLSPERRFQGTGGQGLHLFRALMQSVSTKAMPDGGALGAILGNWFSSLQTKGVVEKGLSPDSPLLSDFVEKEVFAVCRKVSENTSGFDFAKVLFSYYTAYLSENEELQQDALRFLRGEFSSRAEIRQTQLGVRSGIDDQNWYDYLKLYAALFRHIGYSGFVVQFDECAVLHQIPNRISRDNNYEKILALFNDVMQGRAEGLGFYLAVTPGFLEDTARGLFSNAALRTRLAPSRFSDGQQNALFSPLISLLPLTDNEIFALCKRLLLLHASYYNQKVQVSDEDVLAFLQAEFQRAGAKEFLTPREITRDFLSLLNDVLAAPALSFSDRVSRCLSGPTPAPAQPGESAYDLSEIEL